MATSDDDRSDLQAALAARRELGPAYEDAVVESFLERMDRSIEQRVDDRVATRLHELPAPHLQEHAKRQFALGIVSLGTGIPITAVAGGIGHLPGIGIAWLGIVAVNAMHSLGARRR